MCYLLKFNYKLCKLGIMRYTWCYALCYACYVLTFLLHAFAWPLHLPNIDEVKVLNVNRTEQNTCNSNSNKSHKQEEYVYIGKVSHYFSL